MKTRICPLCDQPMKKKHHCDSCNSFVWKPMYLDIHYNTGNQYEWDCSYDAKSHDYDYRDDGSVTMMPSETTERRGRKKFRGVEEIQFPDYTTSRNYRRQESRASRKKGGCLKRFVLIMFLLSMLLTVFEIIFVMVADVGAEIVASPEPDIMIEEDWDGNAWIDSEAERIELSDDDVMSMGEECNGYMHMDVNQEEVLTDIELMLIATLGSTNSIEYSKESYNYAYDYGNGEMDTYYSTDQTYFLDDIIGAYYGISWDTYSGNLHEIYFEMYDRDAAELLYAATMQNLTKSDGFCSEEFQSMMSVAEDEGYVFFNTEGFEVYISYYGESIGYETSYYISITKSM